MRNLFPIQADVISYINFTLEGIWFSPHSLARVIMDDKIALTLLFMGQGTESGKILIHPIIPGLISQVKWKSQCRHLKRKSLAFLKQNLMAHVACSAGGIWDPGRHG